MAGLKFPHNNFRHFFSYLPVEPRSFIPRSVLSSLSTSTNSTSLFSKKAFELFYPPFLISITSGEEFVNITQTIPRKSESTTPPPKVTGFSDNPERG